MKACFLFGLTLSVATGCTSSYDVANEPAPDKHSFAQVNEDAKGQSFTISTVHGEEIDATDLFIGADSASFLEPSVLYTDKRSTIPTSSIKTIIIKHVGAGAVDGLVWGVIVGTPIGALAGAAAEGIQGEATPALATASVIVTAAALGAGVGAIIRHTDEYIFQSTNNNSQKEE
jgi:hypothetical protein